MPKTKLVKRAKWIKRLKSYRNDDPRCRYPWTLSNVGYCWGFACWIDYKKGLTDMKNKYKVDSSDIFCRDCNYWQGI